MTAVDRSYAGSTDTLNQARLDLAAWLLLHGLEAVAADAQLVLSELASNAINASPNQPYRVAADIAEMLVITVSNRSTEELPPAEAWAPESILAPQGRGLMIVNALSDSVHVEQTESGTHVSAYLRIQSRQ